MKKLMMLLVLLLMTTTLVFAQGGTEVAPAVDEPLKVGVIYISSPGDMGYSYMHDQGTLAAEAYFGDKIEVIRLENIPENDASMRAMEQLIDAGCKIIFANSYNYQDYMLQVAKENPDV